MTYDVIWYQYDHEWWMITDVRMNKRQWKCDGTWLSYDYYMIEHRPGDLIQLKSCELTFNKWHIPRWNRMHESLNHGRNSEGIYSYTQIFEGMFWFRCRRLWQNRFAAVMQILEDPIEISCMMLVCQYAFLRPKRHPRPPDWTLQQLFFSLERCRCFLNHKSWPSGNDAVDRKVLPPLADSKLRILKLGSTDQPQTCCLFPFPARRLEWLHDVYTFIHIFYAQRPT